MATLSNYTLPASIRWNKSGNDLLQVAPGGEGGTLVAWTSQYYTFQVQYRTRERYSLAELAAQGSSLRDVWTDWSAWQDPETAVANDISSTTAKSGTTITYTGHPFAFAYDWSQYDMRNVELRVRVFDEPSLTCSEWAYRRLRVVYRPTVTASAEQESDGTISIQVLSDWTRSGSTLTISDPRRCEYNMLDQSLGPYWSWLPWEKWGGVSVKLTDDTGDVTVTAPGNIEQRDNFVYFGQLSFVTGDGAEGITSSMLYPTRPGAAQIWQIQVSGHQNPPGITPPVITATEDDNGNLAVTVSGDYDTASAWYTWTDARGNQYQQKVELNLSAVDTWAGIVEAPPYDVPITISASGTKTGQWASATETATVASHGAVTLQHTATSERVSVLYNAYDTITRRYDNEVETYKPAGSSRPKSRYGEGGRMGIGVSGLSPDIGAYVGLHGAGVAAFAELETFGDWILRIPGGERYAVAVKSYALNNSEAAHLYDVAIELEVVG